MLQGAYRAVYRTMSNRDVMVIDARAAREHIPTMNQIRPLGETAESGNAEPVRFRGDAGGA
jgi:hypothetical protein